MVRICNWDMKIAQLICLILISSICISSVVIFFVFDLLFLGIIALIISLIILSIACSMIVFFGNWPVTIIMDEEKIVVYRLRKEVNRINWQQVKEIYKKEIKNLYRINNFYYFSDGQDRFLNSKDGNEHFVVFACPKKKEHLFLQFTDLLIQDLEKED